MSHKVRRKYRKQRSQKAGLPPGSLIHIGEPVAGPAEIALFDYDATSLEEMQVEEADQLRPYRDRPTVTWINVDGVHQPELIKKLGDAFGLHPLVQEDILNTDQRPKLEDHGDCLYLVFKMLTYSEASQQIEIEQVSLVLGANHLLSFQEKADGDVFDPLREHLRNGRGRLRRAGADYLAYALLDAVVDHYFLVLEKLEDRIEVLEDELLTSPGEKTLQTILHLKRETLSLRHAVWPLREVVNSLYREESELIGADTRLYLRDVYDHIVQVMDVVEDFREMVAGMVDIYLSTLNFRLNEVMKVLTLFAGIFIPLTFIVGAYGMNFKHMPELEWPWAYPVLWFLMLCLGGGMAYYFRRRKWL